MKNQEVVVAKMWEDVLDLLKDEKWEHAKFLLKTIIVYSHETKVEQDHSKEELNFIHSVLENLGLVYSKLKKFEKSKTMYEYCLEMERSPKYEVSLVESFQTSISHIIRNLLDLGLDVSAINELDTIELALEMHHFPDALDIICKFRYEVVVPYLEGKKRFDEAIDLLQQIQARSSSLQNTDILKLVETKLKELAESELSYVDTLIKDNEEFKEHPVGYYSKYYLNKHIAKLLYLINFYKGKDQSKYEGYVKYACELNEHIDEDDEMEFAILKTHEALISGEWFDIRFAKENIRSVPESEDRFRWQFEKLATEFEIKFKKKTILPLRRFNIFYERNNDPKVQALISAGVIEMGCRK